jgi:DNA mismatch endonuclease, patch repair protein
LLNFCQPDIVLPERKLAIFCDGDYWHANPLWMKKRGNTKLTKPQEKNIKRDASQNKLLKENGWNILRLWESDILNDAKSCVDKIESMLN